jgi:hypothetical protein
VVISDLVKLGSGLISNNMSGDMWYGMDILQHVPEDMVDDLAAWTHVYHESFYNSRDKRGAWGLADPTSSLCSNSEVDKLEIYSEWDCCSERMSHGLPFSHSLFHCFIVSSGINTVGPIWQSSSNSLLDQVPSEFGWFKFPMKWVELQGIETVLRNLSAEYMGVYSTLQM